MKAEIFDEMFDQGEDITPFLDLDQVIRPDEDQRETAMPNEKQPPGTSSLR